jgi:fructose-1-phosphate kinase PfkB-like protein
MTRWLTKYCTLAAVTAGADGLYMTHQDKLYHAKYSIDNSNIISTIGSGDCLFAGLCKANLTFEDPRQWARLATACGSANCIYPKLGMLDKADVDMIFDQVTIKVL